MLIPVFWQTGFQLLKTGFTVLLAIFEMCGLHLVIFLRNFLDENEKSLKASCQSN